ncbi:DUF1499 domain-containing protein [Rhizobium sp. TRM95796]|uniref:DUF1499 domain-containing protein n=1 Tax=Rhizobium sp. TRM95796 TaxID=2979862 RepID=UPI0021E77429|nr:DUF1499 domain-containing protein [Rhizobium sp. TRM95796]MCV3766459.1 DUF1499 domain-containing protein [Rhizobium sp. TRM95796]
MPVRYERPVSQSAYSARRLALYSLLFFVVALVLHRFGSFETPLFLAVATVAVTVTLAATAMACVGLAMLWRHGARGGAASAQAILVALPILGAAGWITRDYLQSPPVYDVATDLGRRPQWLTDVEADQSWLGPRLPVGEADRLLQQASYPGLTGRRYEGGLDRVYAAARQVALDMGVRIVAEKGGPSDDLRALPSGRTNEPAADALDVVPVPEPRPDLEEFLAAAQPQDALIQGAYRTMVFGFRQDIVIRLREEEETTLVDVRVAARYGRHDLGGGAALISAYLKALDAALLGLAGG